jgi:hypothetical protein
MSTLPAITVDASWTLVYNGTVSGSFSGGIQAQGQPAVMRCTAGPAPAADVFTGFVLGIPAIPISVPANESVWVRTSYGTATIVMG